MNIFMKFYQCLFTNSLSHIKNIFNTDKTYICTNINVN